MPEQTLKRCLATNAQFGENLDIDLIGSRTFGQSGPPGKGSSNSVFSDTHQSSPAWMISLHPPDCDSSPQSSISAVDAPADKAAAVPRSRARSTPVPIARAAARAALTMPTDGPPIQARQNRQASQETPRTTETLARNVARPSVQPATASAIAAPAMNSASPGELAMTCSDVVLGDEVDCVVDERQKAAAATDPRTLASSTDGRRAGTDDIPTPAEEGTGRASRGAPAI
ncbi:hypothetical protein BH09ACT11_BH09ACT11_06570 [soil metagenome]